MRTKHLIRTTLVVDPAPGIVARHPEDLTVVAHHRFHPLQDLGGVDQLSIVQLHVLEARVGFFRAVKD